jgi:hypothetical protein
VQKYLDTCLTNYHKTGRETNVIKGSGKQEGETAEDHIPNCLNLSHNILVLFHGTTGKILPTSAYKTKIILHFQLLPTRYVVIARHLLRIYPEIDTK